MIDFNIEVDDASVLAMLRKAEERLSPAESERALAEVAVLIIDYNKQQWGKRWKPLAPSTEKQKKDNDEPEVRSGALKAALTEPGAPGQVHEVTPTALRLGTDIFYGRWQDKGTKHQPARKMMRLTPTVIKAIKERLAKRLLPGGK